MKILIGLLATLVRILPDRNFQLARHLFGYQSLRPGQREAVESVLQGRDTLVVMSTGAGKSAIFENFLEAIVELGVQVISVVDGKLTPDSSLDEFQQADHDMLLSIKMAIIRQEKRKLVARMKIGKLRKAKTGARVNGIYPYGDDPRRPEETATLQKMRELRASGATCYAISEHLNKKNIAPRSTAKWTPWAVQKILDRNRQS